MNRKVAAGITLVAVVLVGGYVFIKKAYSRPSVIAKLLVTVTPKEQLNFVADQANSAMFKYQISKASGVAPGLARSLEVKTASASSLLEAKVAVMTREDGRRFAQFFVETLQRLCGEQAQLTLAEQSVH